MIEHHSIRDFFPDSDIVFLKQKKFNRISVSALIELNPKIQYFGDQRNPGDFAILVLNQF